MTPNKNQQLIDGLRILRIELRILNDRIAATVGINPRDLDMLDVIDREGSCTPGYLAARTGVRAATVTGVLARLEDAGWITRSADCADARSALVSATEQFEQLRSLYQPPDGPVRQVFDDLDPDARSAVTAFVRSLASAINSSHEPLRSTS